MLRDLGVTDLVGTVEAGRPWHGVVQLGVARPRMGRAGGK